MTPAITKWVERNEEKFISPAEREHLIDFLIKNYPLKNSINFSYETCLKKADAWVTKLNKKAMKNKSQGSQKTILDFKDGMKIVRLLDKSATQWEGRQMGHCAASYDPKTIYSLRDADNLPHATIEVRHREIKQIKGKGNGRVVSRYTPYINKFVSKSRFKIGNHYDAQALGFIRVDRHQAKDLKATFENIEIFHNRYAYNSPDLKLKKGVDLFSYLPTPRPHLKWYQRDSNKYFDSVRPFITLNNAAQFYKDCLTQSTFIPNRPLVEEYESLFLKDPKIALEIFETFPPRSIDSRAVDILTPLSAFLLRNGLREEAMFVYEKSQKIQNHMFYANFSGIIELEDHEFNKRIITDRYNLYAQHTPEVNNLSTNLLKSIDGHLTAETLNLILEVMPEFDLTKCFDYKTGTLPTVLKEIIKASKDKQKIKKHRLNMILKNPGFIPNFDLESLKLLTEDLVIGERFFDKLSYSFKTYHPAKEEVQAIFSSMTVQEGIKEYIAVINFSDSDSLSLDLEEATFGEKARFIEMIMEKINFRPEAGIPMPVRPPSPGARPRY